MFDKPSLCPITGKRMYITWSNATGAARSLKRNNGARAMIYRCRHCRRYHLSSKGLE